VKEIQLIGLVPAAGYATRLQPLRSSKETLRVRGRPVMLHLIEGMRRADCSTIRVTTRIEKTDVIELAREHGLEVVVSRPDSVSESLLAALHDVPDSAIALVGFPDTLWEPPDALRILADRVRAGSDLALGLFEVDEPERCDVVEVTDAGHIKSIVVKPERPTTNVTWGIFAARVALLRGLSSWAEPGDYFDSVARRQAVPGVLFQGPYEDAGTKESLSRLGDDPVYDEDEDLVGGVDRG
jgi:NDP-sugar pyrophosphorylase family protein